MKKINFKTPLFEISNRLTKKQFFHSGSFNIYPMFIISLWLTLLGCSTMPKERPNDFSIRLSDHGGMLPSGYSIELSNDSSYIEYHVFNARNKVYFQLTDKELDSIYQVCVKQKFDIIKEKKEMVYDRGGTSINLNANGKHIQKSDAGTSFIRKKHAKRFGKVEGMIRKMAREKTDVLKRIIPVHIADSLLTDSTFLHIHVNQGGFTSFGFNSEKDGEQNQIEVPFYLGDNHVSASLVEAGEKKYRRQVFATNQFTVHIADTTQQLYLQKEGEQIILNSGENNEVKE